MPERDDTPIFAFQQRLIEKLIDSRRNNPLLYYSDSKSTRFTMPGPASPVVARLLEGDIVSSDRFAATESEREMWSRRLRALKARAREFEEERGLRTLYAAIGMVSWSASDEGRDPLAPLFLVPLEVVPEPGVRSELAVRRLENAEIVVNRSLRFEAPKSFGNGLGELFEDGTVDDVGAALEAVERLVEANLAMTFEERCALGIFNFSTMAMIDDLAAAPALLAEHPIVRALAGDLTTQKTLVRARGNVVPVQELDGYSPEREPFVLDADPWQAQAIHTLVQNSDANAVLDGPPGTGKSQTIANLIGALIAQGKSVLFVAEKRAALDVVLRRLTAANLDHLVLDLHGSDTKRTQVYRSLAQARRRISQTPPAPGRYDAPYVDARKKLDDHLEFFHGKLPACELSPYQILARLSALAGAPIEARRSYAAARGVNAERLLEIRSGLLDAAHDPALFLGRSDAPWSTSKVAELNVSDALDAVARCARDVLRPLHDLLGSVGFAVGGLDELIDSARGFLAIRAALRYVDPRISELDPGEVQLAFETIESPFSLVLTWIFRTRSKALTALRLHSRPVPNATDHDTAAAARTLRVLDPAIRANLYKIDGMPPAIVRAAEMLDEALVEAAGAIGRPLPESAEATIALLEAHAQAKSAAYRSAYVRTIRSALDTGGFDAFLSALHDQTIEPERWADAFERMWLEAHLETIHSKLAGFNGRLHDGVVEQFGSLEATLREVASYRVQRAAADRFVSVTRDFPAELALLEAQLERTRPRKPLRNLIREASHVVTALTPCVVASPLSVSQFLPAIWLFDTVIFDEGSQVTPAAAVPAIMRGRRVVVAGDDRQLPPTDFFGPRQSEDAAPAGEESGVEGIESIIGAVRPFAQGLGLRVHYRSRDERLAAFSNAYLYGGDLVTFPGSSVAPPIRHVLVAPGTEIDESGSLAEVERVVALVLDHARRRPNESLGVIAFGIPHARRIEAALTVARAFRPELDAFFSETNDEPFFVKNLERVQGDERDAIILTFGYGRTPGGGVSHNFGPINKAGGERRLNVAVTRAKTNMTVVSSFSAADLDPARLNGAGPKLVARYLRYAESHGSDLGARSIPPDVTQSEFEAEVKAMLEAALGTTGVAQYGAGQFRIDLALAHPSDPERFVMAVECDGASYRLMPTARMRDRLRREILTNLGWTFCRIWSPDWFNDRQREIERVRALYTEAVEESDRRYAERMSFATDDDDLDQIEDVEIDARVLADEDALLAEEAGPAREAVAAEPEVAAPSQARGEAGVDATAAAPAAPQVHPDLLDIDDIRIGPKTARRAGSKDPGRRRAPRATRKPKRAEPAGVQPDADFGVRDGACPPFEKGRPITDYRDELLDAVLAWIVSDRMLRTDDEIFEELKHAFGYARRGAQITPRFEAAIERLRGTSTVKP